MKQPLRVVVVTGIRPHHKNLCAVIARHHNIVGIIHPRPAGSSPAARIRRMLRRAKSYGWGVVGAQALGNLAVKQGFGLSSNGDSNQFADGVAAYEEICKPLARFDCDVRDHGSVQLLKSFKPDVTICLGGPVYPKPFIEAGALTFNFHSGISPVYNGAASIDFAFANGHPHLCGGTLMLMGTEVDGGRILGHYLPAITSGDTPRSIFYKTVNGAAVMYSRLLQHFEKNGVHFQHIPQAPALFYTRGFEFNWHHRAMIKRNVKRNLAAEFCRAEQILEYWREATPAAASDVYRGTIERLLWRPALVNGNAS